MHVSDIVFDAIAEIAFSDHNNIECALTSRLADVIAALCLDTGLGEDEVRSELTSRVDRIRSEKARLQVILGGLADWPGPLCQLVSGYAER
jgi:hypothetical protein